MGGVQRDENGDEVMAVVLGSEHENGGSWYDGLERDDEAGRAPS